MEKPLQIVIKESALNDLEQEYEYYATHYSPDYAEKFRSSFFEQVKTILPHALKYPECRYLPTKNQIYRNIIWKNYLIIYKTKRTVAEVLVLFHTKQHPRKFKAVRKLK